MIDELALSSEIVCLGNYYDKLPNSEQINLNILPLVFESISVNTNYTSKIEVHQLLDRQTNEYVYC
jgi:hypothetical protein